MDNRQYRQIVDDYADMVYRIALNQTRRVPDAEDVVQAVFLKLYEKPPTWLGNGLERDGGRAMATEVERGAAREIAEVLGIKEPTVRTRLVRARKLLKQSLKEAWEDEQPEPIQSHDGRGPCLC